MRLAAGADPDTLAWPDLGYAAAYRASYATFRALREEGVVAAGVRSQAEYPTPHAVCGFVHAEARVRVEPSYERALLADLDMLLAAVPRPDLAVQWDVAVEIGEVERSGGQAIGRIAEAIARYADHVPDEVPVGMHLCYGDFGHEHLCSRRRWRSRSRWPTLSPREPGARLRGSPSPPQPAPSSILTRLIGRQLARFQDADTPYIRSTGNTYATRSPSVSPATTPTPHSASRACKSARRTTIRQSVPP